jgi:hypothetical protein
MLQKCVPEYLHDLRKSKKIQSVIENLKCGLTNQLRGQKSSAIVVAKDIVYALVTFDKTNNNRHVVRILGVDHKNIKRAIERRHTLDNNRDAFWLQKRTRKRADVLCEAIVQHIVAFWTLETIISPNSKDVTQRRIRRQQYYLQVS